MIRKILKLLFVAVFLCCWGDCVFAQEGGRVLLDFKEDQEVLDTAGTLTRVLNVGEDYVNDVKFYDEQLEGDTIHKSFLTDIRSKYPQYSEEAARKWQDYVRTGVGGYRLYKVIKQKVVDWLLENKVPLVVGDNQYEMGGSEEYIESDKPLVIKKFKKVIAYSNDEKDQEAAREKYAKDHHLPLPSKMLQKYKEAFLKKDWKTLFGFDFKKYLEDAYSQTETKDDLKNKKLVSFMLPKFDGIDQDGKFWGVIVIVPQKKHFVLLKDYLDYKGLNIDFLESQNAEDITVQFIWPQQVKINKLSQILGYGASFPVYFQGRAIDAKEKVVLRPKVEAVVCEKDQCEQVETRPELVFEPKDKIALSPYGSYVQIVSQNVPRQKNSKKFDFRELLVEEATTTEPKQLRLSLKTDDAVYFKIMLIGDNAKYFSGPAVQLDGKNVTVRFKLLEDNYEPEGKKYTFWVSKGMNSQYLKTMTAKKISLTDTKGIQFSFGILLLAFWGGILLNFMPCVFPVLSLKLLALTKFGGQNQKQVQSNFFCNCVGIVVAFVFIAAGLSFLKWSGRAIGWGMQFQNVYFLVVIIWVVVFFLAHIFGFINLQTPDFVAKVLNKNQSRSQMFEFLSGVFLVLLSTPCMAPYLGTAFGIALAGDIKDIWLAVMTVGLGLALPYLLFAIFPRLAFCVPKPGKWLDFINLLMVLMLIITICWLVSVLAAQSATKELWHWALYVIGVLVILFFRKTLKTEINKLKDIRIASQLHRRANLFFGVILLLIFSLSLFDSRAAFYQKREVVASRSQRLITQGEIQRIVDLGGKVLVKVGADWCLTCSYNNAFVFDLEYIQDSLDNHGVTVIDVDWTHYDEDVLNFMHTYGRQGLPFYVFFSPRFPDGVVLPEIPEATDVQALIEM